MTPAETAKILAKVAAFDQRIVGNADVAAWHEILERYDLAEALEAVTRHHRDSPERCKPAHLVAHIKIIRDEKRKGTSAPLALPRGDDLVAQVQVSPGLATVHQVLDAIARRLAARKAADRVDHVPTESERIHQQALERAQAEKRVRRRGASS